MKIYIEIDVPGNWADRLDMQPYIEKEVAADRWSWHTMIPPTIASANQLPLSRIEAIGGLLSLRFNYIQFARAIEAAHGIKEPT